MVEQIVGKMRCAQCNAIVFYPRECDAHPHKLDATPVPNGAWVVVAWNARLNGHLTTFIGTFDPEHDEGEDRYQDHLCREEEP